MSGRLCGGNLTVLAASLGTPFEIDTAEKILFLEDVGERTYRIDRAVTSLRQAGKIGACSGILLGTFSGCAPAPGGRTYAEVIKEAAEICNIPVISGIPCGHSLPHLTLPLGAQCRVIRRNASKTAVPLRTSSDPRYDLSPQKNSDQAKEAEFILNFSFT